ncbi:MAG: hypothetical protein V4489_06030 [Chlamydiota bacterium]
MFSCFVTEKRYLMEAYARVDREDEYSRQLELANKVCCLVGMISFAPQEISAFFSGNPGSSFGRCVCVSALACSTTVLCFPLPTAPDEIVPIDEIVVAERALARCCMERPQRIAEIAVIEDTFIPVIAAKLTSSRVITDKKGKEKTIAPIPDSLAVIIAQFAAKTSDKKTGPIKDVNKKSALHAGKAVYSAIKILGDRVPIGIEPMDRGFLNTEAMKKIV